MTGVVDTYFCLTWAEEFYREFRGDGVRRLHCKSWTARRTDYNKWLSMLMKTKADSLAMAAPKAAAAASSSSSSTALVAELPPPPLPPPADEPPAQVQPDSVVAWSDSWGCSRCRFSARGCPTCNPDKVSNRLAGF